MSAAKQKTLLLASSLIISLVFAELMLRLFVVQETKRLAIYDKDVGWRGRPNGSEVYVRREDSIAVAFQYNELGYRDDPVQPRSTVAKRIVLLGDSFLENLEAPFESTYVARLRNHLRKQFYGKVDLVALGSQGYSTAQEMLTLKKFGDQLHPDYVVLIFFTGNDFEDNARREFAYLDSTGALVIPPHNVSWLTQQYLSFKRWLYESSHLVFYLKNFIESRTSIQLREKSKELGHESKQYKFEITRKLILATKTLAEQRGSRFALVLFTNKYDISEGLWEKTEFVENICREASIPCLTFKDLDPQWHFFRVDIHFNPEGHRIVAERMAEFLDATFDLRKAVNE
jgi:lysophospholipase L1-like esterase